jgi:hypothetical protein
VLSNFSYISLSSWKTALPGTHFAEKCWIKLTFMTSVFHLSSLVNRHIFEPGMANHLIQIIQKDLQNIDVWCDEGSHHGTIGGGNRKLQGAVIQALTWWNNMLSNNFIMMHSCSRMAHHHILVALSVMS